MRSSSPPWTKPVQIVSEGLKEIIAGIPILAPLSVIPTAASAVDKRAANNEAQDQLGAYVVEIEGLGHLMYLQGPIQNLRQVLETTDARPPLQRLICATEEKESLDEALQKLIRAILLQNLAQILQVQQSIETLQAEVKASQAQVKASQAQGSMGCCTPSDMARHLLALEMRSTVAPDSMGSSGNHSLINAFVCIAQVNGISTVCLG
ncbi:hypothetical protein BDZ89DRAFT_1109345 [Hymenopellis radicata]|nr:hypothetical protein BDZ89DRAFT_1109345 [Hymenopellis radicata]